MLLNSLTQKSKTEENIVVEKKMQKLMPMLNDASGVFQFISAYTRWTHVFNF